MEGSFYMKWSKAGLQTGRQMTAAFMAAALAVLLMAEAMAGRGLKAYAQEKPFSVSQAKQIALANSSAYRLKENELTLAKAQYAQAVKRIRLKEENQRSFRWSPLLNFKLPEKPNLSDAYEYTYKPLELQSKIDNLNHELSDMVYGIYEKVELQFVSVYMLQERIAYNEKRLEEKDRALAKNRARLLKGLANQTDIDALEKNITTLQNTIASDKRSFEAGKIKLGDLAGITLTSGYDFESPFVDAAIDRTMLDTVMAYTLEHDDAFYQVRTASANALLSLNTNYDLMKRQYGANMYLIDSFITQAKTGQKLDAAAFKLKYNEFLVAIDKPWTGRYHVWWFIYIPAIWTKGDIDGVRYVEDEPYALYEAAIEYQNAKAEEDAMRTELVQTVTDTFENYVSVRNSCQVMETDLAGKQQELAKASVRNAKGQMTYEEYTDVQEEYEELQMDYLDTKAALSEILYSFDRLSCGAVSAYFDGTGVSLSAADSAKSYVVEEEGDGIYYYIHSFVTDTIFEFGLSISEGYDAVPVDSYELWVDGTQVGSRTKSDQYIRHVALDLTNAQDAFVRLYSAEEFLDDCAFDPEVYSAKLPVTVDYRIEKEENRKVASYALADNNAGLCELRITPEPKEHIASFQIRTKDGAYLKNDAKTDIRNSFRYLPAAGNDLENLIVCFYDDKEALLYEAVFWKADCSVRKLE